MFETVLSSVGLGSARIDLKLDKPFVKTGELIRGNIYVTGGSSVQKVEGLSVYFMMRSLNASTAAVIHSKIKKIHVSEDEYIIRPDEEKVYPFEFTCPESLPPSSINTRYFFITNLELKNAVDSHDKDRLQVLPNGIVQNLLEGISLLGFKPMWEGLLGEKGDWTQVIKYQPTTYFHGKFHSISFSIEKVEDDLLEGMFEIIGEHAQEETLIAKLVHAGDHKHRFSFHKGDLTSALQAKEKLETRLKYYLHTNNETTE